MEIVNVEQATTFFVKRNIFPSSTQSLESKWHLVVVGGKRIAHCHNDIEYISLAEKMRQLINAERQIQY